MKEEDTVSLKRSNDFLMRNYLKPKLEDFTLGEYTEKVIIYGFLMVSYAVFTQSIQTDRLEQTI